MTLIKNEFAKEFETWMDRVFTPTVKANIVNTVGLGLSLLNAYMPISIDADNTQAVLVINDFDLARTRAYWDAGFREIYFLYTDEFAYTMFFKMIYINKDFRKFLSISGLPWKGIYKLASKEVPLLKKDGTPKKSGTETKYFIEGDLALMPTHFGFIDSNPPFGLGNDITAFILKQDFVDDETVFSTILPISKYKKGGLYKHIMPTTIINPAQAYSASDFDGADTYPIICNISKKEVNSNLSFEDFERKYCVNREEKFGKQFFEEQDKRIAREEANSELKKFVEHTYMVTAERINKYNSTNSVMMNIWTPNYTHGWGAQEIYSNLEEQTLKESGVKGGNYVDWNFRCVDKPLSEVFNVTASGDIGLTATVFKTPEGKKHFLKWWHSAEMHGKFKHCGLSTILLRWMNKPTCCPFDYIIPRVDWDSREWTDEEILADYGYTAENGFTEQDIQNILHYNDDIVPNQWKKKHNKIGE